MGGEEKEERGKGRATAALIGLRSSWRRQHQTLLNTDKLRRKKKEEEEEAAGRLAVIGCSAPGRADPGHPEKGNGERAWFSESPAGRCCQPPAGGLGGGKKMGTASFPDA